MSVHSPVHLFFWAFLFVFGTMVVVLCVHRPSWLSTVREELRGKKATWKLNVRSKLNCLPPNCWKTSFNGPIVEFLFSLDT